MCYGKSKRIERLIARWQRPSIQTRLTLRYIAILGLTLLAYGTLVNVLLVRNAWGLIDRDLAHEAQKANQLWNLRPDIPLAAYSTALFDLGQSLSPDILVQVMGTDGQVVAHSANVGAAIFPDDQHLIAQALAGQPVYITFERRHIWLRAYLSPLTEDGQVIGLLWVARSLETLGAALDWLQAILAGVGVLALVAAGAWGRNLARSALRPVDEMTRIARDIGQTQDFGRRVVHAGAPDELGRLADTFNAMLASLQAAHERTENALMAQRRFVADASHELRTPLTSVRGNVGILRHMLAQSAAAPADHLDILTDVDNELARLSRLVDGLLTLARADAGQHIVRAPLELSTTVRSFFRQMHDLSVRITFRLECQDELTICGSADHLTQLLRILLDNAIAYTPAGGQVSVSLSRERDDAVLCVSDTGIGIDSDDLPHIFDRFYRGRAARRLRGDGAGLGLAIAAWIVAEHDGQIAVSREPGQGSCFSVRLPVV